ncbi:MAG: hypothetical protein LBO62_07430, partial [Endomicrobium sp.]|nr:hypothetical protein [Endomicrobium sp.]
LGHFEFFKNYETKREVLLYGGSFLYAANAFAAEFIINNNITDFVCPIESDFQNISELAKIGLSGNMIFYLSGFAPLALSNISPCKDLKDGGILESEKDFFNLVNKNGKTIVLPKYPITLFNKKEKLKKLAINKFLIDLSFIRPNEAYLSSIIDAYNGKSYISNACEFNFSRELK